MPQRSNVASIAFTGAAATATLGLAAGPAAAAVSWHVKNGTTGYKGAVKAKNKAGTKPSLKDTTTGFTLTCSKDTASGSVSKSRSGASAARLGVISKANWSACPALFVKFKAHLTTRANVVAKKYTASRHSVSGKLSGNKISIVFSGASGNTCKATFSGTSVPVKYLDTPHSFSVNPAKTATLTVKKVSGNCFNQLQVGNTAYFHGLYHVSAPTALTITRS